MVPQVYRFGKHEFRGPAHGATLAPPADDMGVVIDKPRGEGTSPFASTVPSSGRETVSLASTATTLASHQNIFDAQIFRGIHCGMFHESDHLLTSRGYF